MKLTVQLKGVDTLSLRTKALIEAARTGGKLGVSEAGGIFEQEAKLLVPVKTGHLRDSIHMELLEASDNKTVVAVTPVYEDGGPYGIDPAYARRIEFGFMGVDSLGRAYHQAAESYMRQAYDNKKDEGRQTVVDSIYQQLDSVRRAA